MIARIVLAGALAAAAAPAPAADFGSLGRLSQGEFRSLAEDLGAAFAYKGVAPAAGLGVLGLDVGLEVTDTRLAHGALFERAGEGGHSDLVVAKVHVRKGLPGGIDIGAFAGVPSSFGAALFGADLGVALLRDSLATPAVALRLSGTRATGTGNVRVSTAAIDAMVSKGFTAITPYAGAGVVRVMARGAGFGDESFDRGRAFAGIDLNLAAVDLAFEAEKMGGTHCLSAKLGLRF